MPIIEIKMLEGRSDSQKADLVRELTHAACRTIDTNPEKVRVIITEMQKNHYGISGKLVKDS